MANYNQSYRAKNLGKNRNGKDRDVKFIVLHDTAGNGGIGDVKYLASDPEGRGVSVDFVVPKDGTVYQLNPSLPKYWTFHAGRNTFFRDYSNGNVNVHSVGIEIGQKANMKGLDPAYPDVQVVAVAELCRDLCTGFGLSKTDITTHSKIIRDGSRSDPRNFPWTRFWEVFNGAGAVVGEAVSASMWHVVKPGDTLWGLSRLYLTSVESIKALNNMNDTSNVITLGQRLLVKE